MAGISEDALLTALETLRLRDKISFIFLLNTDYQEALHLIQQLNSSESSSEENGFFKQFILGLLVQDKESFFSLCIESLSLLKNYRVLRLLGFSRSVAHDQEYNGKVHILRRQLYILAESLTTQQTIDFVQSMYGSTSAQVSNCQLEEAILQLVADGTVSLDLDNPESLIKMTKHLDKYGEVTRCIKEKLRSLSGDEVSYSSSEEFYPILNPSEVGFCVVINQETFTRNSSLQHLLPDELLSPRVGSAKDVNDVKEIFSWLGFKVFIHNNTTFEDLKLLLSEYAQSIPLQHSQFILVLMSHGTEEVVYTSDSVPVKVEDIEMAFQAKHCPNLLGKPKIIIVQACQGKNLQRVMVDGVLSVSTQENSNYTLPERGDALIAWSTVKGFASFRDRLQGSWFIQELCSELKRSAHNRDLVDIVTRVNNRLRHKSYQGMHMVPSLSLSLCKKIRFPLYQC